MRPDIKISNLPHLKRNKKTKERSKQLNFSHTHHNLHLFAISSHMSLSALPNHLSFLPPWPPLPLRTSYLFAAVAGGDKYDGAGMREKVQLKYEAASREAERGRERREAWVGGLSGLKGGTGERQRGCGREREREKGEGHGKGRRGCGSQGGKGGGYTLAGRAGEWERTVGEGGSGYHNRVLPSLGNSSSAPFPVLSCFYEDPKDVFPPLWL